MIKIFCDNCEAPVENRHVKDAHPFLGRAEKVILRPVDVAYRRSSLQAGVHFFHGMEYGPMEVALCIQCQQKYLLELADALKYLPH